MTKKMKVCSAIFSAMMLCAVSLAQEPVVDISKEAHPNLYEAQRLVVEANQRIAEAQKDNHDDMRGHAEKARQLLAEVNRELKAAAEAANKGGGMRH